MKRSRIYEAQPSADTTRLSAVSASQIQNYLVLSEPMEWTLCKLAEPTHNFTLISVKFRGMESFEQGYLK
jgi:hypothetical protein